MIRQIVKAPYRLWLQIFHGNRGLALLTTGILLAVSVILAFIAISLGILAGIGGGHVPPLLLTFIVPPGLGPSTGFIVSQFDTASLPQVVGLVLWWGTYNTAFYLAILHATVFIVGTAINSVRRLYQQPTRQPTWLFH